jgi:hypothetical protein
VEPTVTLRDQLSAGLVAGFTGGIMIDLFLFGVQVINGTPLGAAIAGSYTFIASALIGPSASNNPFAVEIGLVLHFCVAIAWAFGYVYLVRQQPQLLARPWISGAVFGIVVYTFMEIVLLTAGLYHRPKPVELEIALVAHIVFYGIPVGLIVSRSLRRT